ncbi:MAG: N-acetylmuramoyl-L-alanine amidase [Syntrophales bacterium]|nr:N-acetylmuramoyl-L-alanine amidase [Syntrophales bacterium]MDD5640959.1 N-acetylmuramoyl-L-alanine amidase [Syntrophales bacterium]
MNIVNILILSCISVLFFHTAPSGDCWAKDYKIAIDIGHTPNIPGATSARGVPEYLFNKHIGDLLYQQLLQNRSFKGSFIINATGADISLYARAAIANKQGADLFISIHHDSVYPKDLSGWLYQGQIMPHCDKFSGYSIFYSEKNGNPLNSLVFAVILGSEMLRAGFHPTLHHVWKFTGGDKDLLDKTRGIYKYNNLVVLKETDMPAVLFECGIIKSRSEELKLCNHNYQQKLVATLFMAIRKYLKEP